MPVAQAIDQVLDGGIGDAKTVAGLLAYWRRRVASIPLTHTR